MSYIGSLKLWVLVTLGAAQQGCGTALWATLPWDNEWLREVEDRPHVVSLDAPWEGQGFCPGTSICDALCLRAHSHTPLGEGLGSAHPSCVAREPYAWLISHLGWVNRLWEGRAQSENAVISDGTGTVTQSLEENWSSWASNEMYLRG